MFKRSWIVLIALGLSTSALAQDDDDLAPLTPVGKAKPKAKPAAKPKAAPKAPAPKPKAKQTQVIDDDLAPIAPIARTGEVNVKVPASISGAVLSIDGREVGILPMGPQSVTGGEHTFTVKRAGYAAFVKKVQVGGGKKIDLDAKLVAVAAVLSVTSDVAGAQVLINGRSIGYAPLTEVEVPAGYAEVAVVKEGFREDTQRINFVAGRDYPIVVKFNPGSTTTLAANDRPVATNLAPIAVNDELALRSTVKEEPITSKWYFWVGIAVGVAAVAAGTAVAITQSNQNAQANKLNENQICGESGCDGCIGLMCKGTGFSF